MAVNVIDIIKPKNSGSFPIVEDVDFLGGFRSVENITARNAIPSGKRKEGMQVCVSSENIIYELSGGITDDKWKEINNSYDYRETIGNVTLYVDPNVGLDIDPTRPVVITNGSWPLKPFASFAGALAALPNHIRHTASLLHVSGTYNISNLYLGDLSSKSVAANAYISFDSVDGFVRVSGTVESQIQTSVQGYTITLQSDPGYADNAHRGKWLRISSGSGENITGQYKAIRSHVGATFEVAGRFWPLVLPTGDRVEIVEPSTTLIVPDSSFIRLNSNVFEGRALVDSYNDNFYLDESISFRKITLKSIGGSYFSLSNINIIFDGTILDCINTYISQNTKIELNNLICTSDGSFAALIFGDVNVICRGGTSESSWLIRNYQYAFYCQGSGYYAYLYKGSVDDCVHALYLTGIGVVDLYCSSTRSSGNTGYGIYIPSGLASGVLINLDISNVLLYGSFKGALGDVNLENNIISYATINSEPSQHFVSPSGCVIKGY